MQSTLEQSTMRTASGQTLPLVDMSLDVELRDTLALVEQTQVWRNTEPVNIEAIYTFPLPLKATLLEVRVELNERTIQAEVVERQQAEQQYEEALLDGNTAMLLERCDSGLYTLNLGNLLAEDCASVHIRYALPLQWEERLLRLALPTTVAPRYGSSSAAGLKAHQTPRSDILVENRYRLEMRIGGALCHAGISSPSHAIQVSQHDQETLVCFAEGSAPADRDLVICLTTLDTQIASASLASGRDVTLLHAAFPIPLGKNDGPLAIKILIDGSGSMAGDSMYLARRAAHHALAALKQGDSYAISAFGSVVVHAKSNPQRMLLLNDRGVDPQASLFARQVDANLGGTEMLDALEVMFALEGTDESRRAADLLLITDGETWARDEIVRLCRDSKHRVFVIGCGACPAESVVRDIAEATGGAAVFAGPGEDVKAIVERHMQRMRQPRVTSASLNLQDCLWQSPSKLARCAFVGTTLHVFSALRTPLSDRVELLLTFDDGRQQAISATVQRTPEAMAADVVRVGFDAYLREQLLELKPAHNKELTALAVQHQLISPFTHYLMVEQRGHNAASADPALRQVPGMLAAGWGGSGQAQQYLDLPTFMRRGSCSTDMCMKLSITDYSLMRNDRSILSCTGRTNTPIELIEALNESVSLFGLLGKPPYSVSKLVELTRADGGSIPSEIIDDLESLIDNGWPEDQVVSAFLHALLDHHELSASFYRSCRRAILRAARDLPPTLTEAMQRALADTETFEWGWSTNSHWPVAHDRA